MKERALDSGSIGIEQNERDSADPRLTAGATSFFS